MHTNIGLLWNFLHWADCSGIPSFYPTTSFYIDVPIAFFFFFYLLFVAADTSSSFACFTGFTSFLYKEISSFSFFEPPRLDKGQKSLSVLFFRLQRVHSSSLSEARFQLARLCLQDGRFFTNLSKKNVGFRPILV